jgi:hypothetical protein
MIILLESDCVETLINQRFIGTLKAIKEKSQIILKSCRISVTQRKCEVTLTIPDFNKHREITCNFFEEYCPSYKIIYDLIIGRGLMHEIGLDETFSRVETI